MTKPSSIDQVIEMLRQKKAEDAAAGIRQTGWQRWILPVTVTVVTVVALAKPALTVVGAFAGGSSSSGDTYESTCVECGETFDEGDLDEGRRCEDCSEIFPDYCCGVMYENGEEVCGSCGEPLSA